MASYPSLPEGAGGGSRAFDDPPTVLVTGAAGFIGSHLCERLLEQGERVLALDDLSTGSVLNLQHLLQHPNLRFSVQDVTQLPVSRATAVPRVFNLACPASPAQYQRTPVQTTLTSVQGAWRTLELVRASAGRLLQASTSEVYGDPREHPQHERYHGHVNPVGPRSCYDEGKRCAEALCFAYWHQYGTQVRIARIFNTYGPHLQPGDGRVVSNFIVQALRGEPLTVHGEGLQTRSFCYVSDTVEALQRLMQADVEGPINIGNPIEHTVLELAERILRLTRSRSTLVRHPMPPDDPHRRCPDITLARAKLQWQPTVDLDDGLRMTIDWFRHALQLLPHVVLPGRTTPAAA